MRHLLKTRRIAAVAVVAALAATGLGVRHVAACFMRSPQPVQVWLDHIDVEIRDQVAVKTYNCTFKNPNPQAVVGGECYMELEPGAQVDDMSVWVDGKEMKAEILDVDKAKSVFTDIVKNGGSPALLEYFGNQLITTKVPRVAPNGTVTVKLKYTTVLKKKGGLVRLQMLNTNPKALMQPLKSASVSVKISSQDPIKNLYSPTHKIKIEEEKDWDVVVKWDQDNYMPKHPFVLYYDTDQQKVGAGLVAQRELDEEGSFMLMLSPTVGQGEGRITDKEILPKDVVFCVDTSGSMLQGNKMQQAKTALEYCVKHLRSGDRFNIVPFSTTARAFAEKGLVEFNEESQQKALRYVQKLSARGGTAIEEALERSLTHLGDGDRLKMVLFATDGLPTIGERDPNEILKSVYKKNTNGVRMFVFGEGFDVNTKLLDFLALNHRGEADYILPDEDIAKKISHFFDRVGSPIMTDLKVEFEGLDVKDVFPRNIKDVFRGEQIIVYGRYNGHGEKTVKVTGRVNGKQESFTYKLDFPEISEDDKNSFVPRLWAGKKVDYLLSEIRKTDEPPKELVEEVTYLAKRYGIITPYTSYLMTDDIAMSSGKQQQGQLLFRTRALGAGGGFGGNALPAASAPAGANIAGRPAADLDAATVRKAGVEAAKKLSEFRRDQSGGSDALDRFAEEALESKSEADGKSRGGRKRSALQALRYIGTRTFYSSNKVWYESGFDSQKDKIAKTVKVGSEGYVELLLKDGRLAKYLALGDVVLKVDGKWYRFQSKS